MLKHHYLPNANASGGVMVTGHSAMPYEPLFSKYVVRSLSVWDIQNKLQNMRENHLGQYAQDSCSGRTLSPSSEKLVISHFRRFSHLYSINYTTHSNNI